jgi:hypothetical protein
VQAAPEFWAHCIPPDAAGEPRGPGGGQLIVSKEPKGKRPRIKRFEAVSDISLTMSYFHTGIRTIIGAEAFHCPVRDGKEWDHLAMVIRLNLLPPGLLDSQGDQFTESNSSAF